MIEMNVFKDVVNSSLEKEENYITEVLKRNYPDVDLSNIDEVTNLINKEGIYIERKQHDIDFEDNTVRVTSEIRIYKQLR